MIIHCTNATTLPELIAKLEEIRDTYKGEFLYVFTNQSDVVRIDVQEHTLTDKSVVHDVIIK